MHNIAIICNNINLVKRLNISQIIEGEHIRITKYTFVEQK